NLARVRFEGEMAGVEEVDDRMRDVALERFGTGWQEERIVPAPHGEKRRLAGPEILLEGRIERDGALVVAEEGELQLVRAREGQVKIVERIAIRGSRRSVRHAVRVLPNRRLGRQERS